MSFKFDCPHCGQHISAALEDVGDFGGCPACQNQFVVPSPLEVTSLAPVEIEPPVEADLSVEAAPPVETEPAPTVVAMTQRGAAILALLLSIFPAINLFALGLAIYAVVRSDRPGRGGERGLAITAVVVTGVLFVPVNLAGTLAATLSGSATFSRMETLFRAHAASPSPTPAKPASHH